MSHRRRARLVLPGALGGVGVVFGVEAGGRLAAQVAVLVSARLLGPTDFGRLVVATAVFSLAAIVADAGIGTAGLQRLSGDRPSPDRLQAFLSARLALAAVCGFVAGMTLVAATLWRATWTASAVLLFACLPYALLGNAALTHRIKERFGRASLASAATVTLLAVGGLLFALIRPTATSAAAGAVILTAAAAAIWSWREPSATLAWPRLSTLPRMLALGWPHLVTAGAVALYSRGDRLVVAAVVGDRAAGVYGAAYALVFGVSLLGTCIQQVALPIMIHARCDPRSWRRAVHTGLAISALLAAPVGLALYAGAHVLMRVLYGPSYTAAAEVLQILALLVPAYFINPFLGTVLIASDRERVLARVALVNVAVAALAYPVATATAGVSGAALASVLVEAVGGGLLLVAIRQDLTDVGEPSAEVSAPLAACERRTDAPEARADTDGGQGGCAHERLGLHRDEAHPHPRSLT